MSVEGLPCNKPGVAVFYPGASLKNQLTAWFEHSSRASLESSSARSSSGIRRALRDAELVLLDATDKPERAIAAFQLSAARLGGYSVAVYTEVRHDWLELFVRRHGALLLLGPLDGQQWEEVFEYMSSVAAPRIRRAAAAGRIDRDFARSTEIGLRENCFSHLDHRRPRPAQLWSTQTPRRQAS